MVSIEDEVHCSKTITVVQLSKIKSSLCFCTDFCHGRWSEDKGL